MSGVKQTDEGQQEPRFLTVREAADVLACSPDTVRRMIREGRIPAERPRGRYRIPHDGMLRALEADQ